MTGDTRQKVRGRSMGGMRRRFLTAFLVIIGVFACALGWALLLAWLAGSVHPLAAAAAFLIPLAVVGALIYARHADR